MYSGVIFKWISFSWYSSSLWEVGACTLPFWELLCNDLFDCLFFIKIAFLALWYPDDFYVVLTEFVPEFSCQLFILKPFVIFYSFFGYFLHLHFELSDSFLRSYYSSGAFILWDFNLSYHVFQFWHFCFHFYHFRAYIPCVLLVVHSIISLTLLNTLDIFNLKVF